MATGAAAAVLLAGFGFVWLRPAASVPTERSEPTELVIAVEPFVPSGHAAEASYLPEALAQEILVEVGSVVLPEGRLLTQWLGKDTGETVPSAEPAPPADYHIAGSYSWTDSRVRVASTLRNSETGEVVWGETFESPQEDLLQLQQSLARRIASAVAATLLGTEDRRTASWRPQQEEAAYDEYLKGVYLRGEDTVPSLRAALEHFDRATELDARSGQAFAALAMTHLRLAFQNDGEGHWEGARTAVDRALARDPGLAEAHIARGLLKLYRDWDFTEARQSLRQALALAPGWGEAHRAYASYLTVVGRFEEGIPRARLARRLDPAGLSLRADLCWYLVLAQRFSEAESECRRSLELEPGDASSRLGLAEALRHQGDIRRAFKNAALALGAPEPPPEPASEGEAHEQFVRLWQQAFETRYPSRTDNSSFYRAAAGALADHKDEALALLEQALAERAPALLHFRTDPRFSELVQEERFQAIVSRIGLPPS